VKTIAVCNHKGGVAKTTTCLSLGACLVELGHSVLLIDLDPQAHLTLSVGFNPEKLRRTGCDALLANTSLVSISRETSVVGLDIVPANQHLALVDKLLYQQPQYEFRLQRRLAEMSPGLFDFVLIDCPPSFGTLTLNALTAAHTLVIPAQCEYYAAKSLRSILALAKLVQQKTNPKLRYRLVVTMFDRRNRICGIVHNKMQQELRPLLFKTIIELDPKLGESPAYGRPITAYAPESRGTQQYRALAKELITVER
jgi:chromosome partitioning protein